MIIGRKRNKAFAVTVKNTALARHGVLVSPAAKGEERFASPLRIPPKLIAVFSFHPQPKAR